MNTEKFKGDDLELKFEESARPIFDQASASLDEFYANGYTASPFLLMLYDEKRIPFSERVNKNAFVEFIKEVINRYPFVGNFDTYLFVLRAIFGQLSEIVFTVPSAGILEISVNATSALEFEFIGEDGTGVFNVSDSVNDILIFRGVSGIETEYDLELLFSEIMPAGITPHISLTFFERYDFVADDGLGGLDPVVDHLGNQIVFMEIGA